MKEEKSPATKNLNKKGPNSDETEEVDVSFDDNVPMNNGSSSKTLNAKEGEPASIPEEWKGKSEAEISLLLELQQLKKKLETSEKEWFDKYARLQAEFENFRRRSLKEKDDYIKYASSQLILKLLNTLDNFEIMLKNLERKLPTNEFKGLQMIYKELYCVLEKEGLTQIKAKGEKFDPFVHEILTMDYTNSCPEDTILEEFQKGYKLKDQVLRTSKVKIAKSKKKEPEKIDSNPKEEEHKTD
jgi:molecular chaperone GrpE